ncbi:DUF960 domain-containing protein [Cytobacillus firmus]|uniref:DUF960 family protein n=1 Tax=Cytobacillus firmus TaxID=1399 RepID=UPI0021897FF6|nr:DUF960 family protein [Cytobacillus firmus]URM33404.1 DUF960 domain-containing protein [Cytobacillus firmus]
MFEDQGKRYMTRSIAETLHIEIQLFLWSLLDEKVSKEEELDYLQVFELSVKNGKQCIIHRQEQPPNKQQWIVELQHTKPLNCTIWCMDNGSEGQIMLYPSDY